MNGTLKDKLYEQLARVGQALANGHRLELVDLLCQGERSVEELAAEARLGLQNASQHLQVLHRAHLLERRRVGTQIRYRISTEEVGRLWLSLREVAAGGIPEVSQVVAADFSQPDPLEPIDQAELERRMIAGEVLVIDVRPAVEYWSGHLKGAISIPLAELGDRGAGLPRDKEVVAYCRGPYCLFAGEAVVRLRQLGISARRLTDGFPEWELAGRPVARGAA